MFSAVPLGIGKLKTASWSAAMCSSVRSYEYNLGLRYVALATGEQPVIHIIPQVIFIQYIMLNKKIGPPLIILVSDFNVSSAECVRKKRQSLSIGARSSTWFPFLMESIGP
jgi:hypothetical protein